MQIWRVSLAILALAIIAGVRADDFPIKKFGPFTYVVDYEASWSPDSRQISFDSRPTGHSHVFVINAEGGQPRQLTQGNSENGVASWSLDGKWILSWGVFHEPVLPGVKASPEQSAL